LIAERLKKPERGALWLYTVVTAVVAMCAAAAIVRVWGAPDWREVAFFYALSLLAVSTSIEVPISVIAKRNRPSRGVTLSPGFIVLLTVAYSARPSTAVIVALVPSLALAEWRRPDALRVIFNTGQEALAFGTAAVVFATLRPSFGSAGLFVAAAAAAFSAEFLNTMLVAGAVAIDRRIAVRDALRKMAWTIPHSLTFAVAALLVSTLYKEFGPAAAALLFMPFLALRFVRKSKLELDAAHDRAIREFVRAVELKDPYTRNHSERVAEIVVAIHREMGTPEKELSDRYLAALLHDVGKVVVPSAILTKPGPLTPDEYEQVKRHVTVGARAVSKIDLLAHLEDEVLLHHERLDGTGYPFGLRADAIPHNVQILSVADCFEAMTSSRVYRSAMPVSAAVDELRRVAGGQLAEAPVEALIRVLESGVVFVNPSIGELFAAERPAVGEA
jgi:hypothetical protein